MQLKLLGAEYLTDDAKFWETEQHFETLEVHAHGFLPLGVWISRILRGILCLSMSDAQPLAIDLRRWPQTWRRAVHAGKEQDYSCVHATQQQAT
jgi:hypothetical protein